MTEGVAGQTGEQLTAQPEFRDALSGLSAGMRSSPGRSDCWVEMSERLAALISGLPTRRRQALVMLIFALSQRMLTPEQADEWIDTHDVDSDEGVEALIGWLRQFPAPEG